MTRQDRQVTESIRSDQIEVLINDRNRIRQFTQSVFRCYFPSTCSTNENPIAPLTYYGSRITRES